jgi:hypothetical protein
MKKATIHLAAVLSMVLLLSLSAAAQNQTGFVGWGIRGGFDVSNIIGNDAVFPGDLPYKTKVGVTGGLWATFGLSERFAVQFEGLYSMKGSRVISGANKVEYDIQYVEFPVLLKMRAVEDMAVKPSIYAGPILSLKVADKVIREYREPEIPLSQADQIIYAMDPEADGDSRSFDYGFVIGVDFHVVEDKAVFDVRYTHGMKTLDKTDAVDIRNSNVSISIGYAF